MTATPKQIVANFDGVLVALTSAGTLFELPRSGQEWQPMDGPDGERVISIAVKPNGPVVAVTQSGKDYEQFRSGTQDYSQSWRALPDFPK
jgi:hypothetical protein